MTTSMVVTTPTSLKHRIQKKEAPQSIWTILQVAARSLFLDLKYVRRIEYLVAEVPLYEADRVTCRLRVRLDHTLVTIEQYPDGVIHPLTPSRNEQYEQQVRMDALFHAYQFFHYNVGSSPNGVEMQQVLHDQWLHGVYPLLIEDSHPCIQYPYRRSWMADLGQHQHTCRVMQYDALGQSSSSQKIGVRQIYQDGIDVVAYIVIPSTAQPFPAKTLAYSPVSSLSLRSRSAQRK